MELYVQSVLSERTRIMWVMISVTPVLLITPIPTQLALARHQYQSACVKRAIGGMQVNVQSALSERIRIMWVMTHALHAQQTKRLIQLVQQA